MLVYVCSRATEEIALEKYKSTNSSTGLKTGVYYIVFLSSDSPSQTLTDFIHRREKIHGIV